MKKLMGLLVVFLSVIFQFSVFAGENLELDITQQPESHLGVVVDRAFITLNKDNSIDLEYYEYHQFAQGMTIRRFHFAKVDKVEKEDGSMEYMASNTKYDDGHVGARESLFFTDYRGLEDQINDSRYLVTGGFRQGYGWCGTGDFSFEFGGEFLTIYKTE